MKQSLKQVIKDIKGSQTYCREYNGRPDCKNCGAKFDWYLKVLEAVYDSIEE